MGAEIDNLSRELTTLLRENAALKEQLLEASKATARLTEERDAARENFLGAMQARDAALSSKESLERLVAEVKTRSSERASRIEQLEKENAALVERLQRSVA